MSEASVKGATSSETQRIRVGLAILRMSRLVEILYLSRLVSRYIGVTEQHSISLRYKIVGASAKGLGTIAARHPPGAGCVQDMSAGVLIRRSPKQFEVTAYELLIVMRIVAFESSDEVAPQFVEFRSEERRVGKE